MNEVKGYHCNCGVLADTEKEMTLHLLEGCAPKTESHIDRDIFNYIPPQAKRRIRRRHRLSGK